MAAKNSPCESGYSDDFSFGIIQTFLCSNKNRAAILYLLKNCENEEIKAEEIANKLGISHRTVLYHLNILEEYDLIGVKRYRRKGEKQLKSAWGINRRNKDVINALFKKVDKYFTKTELEGMININIPRR